jgi:Transposase DDE domain
LKNKKSKVSSHYQRLIRFFKDHSEGNLWELVLEFSLKMLNADDSLLYLDATEWKIGSFKLHILMLAFHYKEAAIPLFFVCYEHKGVWSEQARIDFIKAIHEKNSLKKKTLPADREFIGDKWLQILPQLGINFVIRLRKGQYKKHLKGGRSYEQLEQRAQKKGKASALILIEGREYRLWVLKNASKSEEEALIYLLSSDINKRNSPILYRLRWKIESLFKHLKSNGFNLEDIRFKNLHKIRLMMAVLVLAYCIAIREAIKEEYPAKAKKIHYKKEKIYLRESIFRHGLDLFISKFMSFRQFVLYVLQNPFFTSVSQNV